MHEEWFGANPGSSARPLCARYPEHTDSAAADPSEDDDNTKPGQDVNRCSRRDAYAGEPKHEPASMDGRSRENGQPGREDVEEDDECSPNARTLGQRYEKYLTARSQS